MPRYVIHVELFVRPAQEDEPPVIIEVSEERAAPLLANEFISLAAPEQAEEESAVSVAPPEEVKEQLPAKPKATSLRKSDARKKN